MILDIKTLVMVLIVISFISAFALFFFYRILKQIDGLKYAALGGALQALACCFLLIRDPNDPTVAIMLTNVCYLMSSAFYYQTARVLTDQKTSWLLPLGLIIVLMPLIFVLRTHEYISERIIVSTFGVGAFFVMSSYVVFKNAMKLPGRIILAVTCLSGAIVCLLTILSLIITPERIQAFSDFHVFPFILLWFLVNNFFTTLSIILLTSEKLQQRLKVQVDLLGQARDVANQSLQQQRHFLSMLSHEFKAPIGAIQANADAVLHLQKDKSSIIEDSLNRIKNVSNRLTSLVDHCLNNEWLAHSIKYHQTKLEPLSLTEVVDSICDEFSVRFKRGDKDAEINGEPMFLPVLFSNLVANACKHASDISAVEVELLEDSQHYYVNVVDDGPGISEAEQKHIFDRYYQTNSDELNDGSGLGLYFVKRIAELHEGTVTVNCDKNTIFTVMFEKPEISYL